MKHHPSICEGMKSQLPTPQTRPDGDVTATPKVSGVTSNNYCYVDRETNVLLQTATATVTNVEQSKSIQTRMLFDLGSQKSYCTLSVKNALNLPTLKKEWLMIKTFREANPRLRECDSLQLRIQGTEGTSLYLNVFAVDRICSPLSNQTIELTQDSYPHLRAGLQLADNTQGETDLEVHILIGADHYWNFVSDETVRGGTGTPVATNSKLGWLLIGPSATGGGHQQSVHLITTHVMKVECSEIDPLTEQVSRFWDLDSIGIKENEPSVYETFVENIKHDGTRYEVNLPWKPSHPLLPDNFALSLGRLRSLTKRLQNNPKVFYDYNQIIVEQEQSGIIERVDIENLKPRVGETNYLPHREVIKEDRTTTKTRIVYDGSAKLRNSVSLNNCLYSCPSLVPLLYDVLLRFRIFPIAITADIAHAFLNISIAEHDRDSLRFLWLENYRDKNSKVIVFR